MDIVYLSHVAFLLIAPVLVFGLPYRVHENRDHGSVDSFLVVRTVFARDASRW